MKSFALSTILLSLATVASGATLTFDEAVALATKGGPKGDAAPLRDEIASLRWSRLPSVRAEVTTNASRTLDLFAEGPLEVRYAQSVLAFDYPLWDGGATQSRIALIEAKLRRIAERGRLDDGRFTQLVDAFGELYVTKKQSDLLRPLADSMANEASESERLLEKGEISNLGAMERREIALSFASRLLELEARRIDAAARLRLLTGLESEPDVLLDLSEAPSVPTDADFLNDDRVAATTIAVEESRARVRDVRASGTFRAMLSGFVGVGAAESNFRDVRSDGAFGVYGVRLHLSYPLFRGTSGVPLAEARGDLEQSLAMRDAAIDAARARAAEYRLREETAGKRVALLQKSVETAKEREESLKRLIAAGVRSDSDLIQAQAERIRREADLLAAEIDRWKAARLLARMSHG